MSHALQLHVSSSAGRPFLFVSKIVSIMENPLKKFKSNLKGFHDVDLSQTSYLIKSDTSGVIKMLRELSHHHDSRLRSSALETLFHLHGEGTILDISLFSEFCECLKDNYGGCRLTAMKLLEIMAQNYGDCLVCSGKDDEQIRLADDTFAKICNMMSDIEVSVRIEAAKLLGNFKNVSPSFLDQTLDKKLMSNLRKKKSAHERNRESAAAGEWSSGKKWADDAPQEEVCPESVNLMDIGACGAFVHGLEDEFLDVRMASLESITSLAEVFNNFAHQSLDFIVDMFNDEIEEIRLKAIQCLQKISSKSFVVLRDDQVEIILSALEDHNVIIREALHDLIGSCQMESTSALRSSIESLTGNLNKNPKDKQSIYKCFMNLGLHHPEFTSNLVTELLGIHPFLVLPEPSLEDISYICVLILILNAASKQPSILDQLEKYAPRHYSYLRHANPDLVPVIPFYDKDEVLLKPSQKSTQRSERHTKNFLTNVFKRIKNSTSNEQVEVQKAVFELAIKDLDRLSQVESSMKAACDFLRGYLSCQLSIRKILLNNNWINAFLLSPLQSSHFRSSLQQILVQTFLLKYRFHGAHPIQVALVQQTRVKALALQLMAIIYGSNASALALCGAFIEELDHLRTHLVASGIKADPLTEAMMKEIKSLEEPKPGSVARVLQPLFLSSQSLTSQLADVSQMVTSETLPNLEKMTMCKAKILEPVQRSDHVIKFTAGLVLSVKMVAMVYDIHDLKLVRIKIKYPDQKTHIVVPKESDFKNVSKNESSQNYRLETNVYLSHVVWSEACQVELGLVIDFRDVSYALSVSQLWAAKTGSFTGLKSKPEDNMLVDLCPSVKLNISPKAPKRGLV